MKPLEDLELGAADVKRIDEIIGLETGQGLAAETAHWRRRRNGFWIAVTLSLLLLVAAGFFLYRFWA